VCDHPIGFPVLESTVPVSLSDISPSIDTLADGLRRRLADGMPLDAAVEAMDMDAVDIDAMARASDERREAQARLREAALQALDESSQADER